MSSSSIEPGQLRIGDAERQQTADQIARAHALGQLEVDEFHERIEKAHSARTQDDLNVLLLDLPGATPTTKKPWASPLTQDRLKAAGAMLATVPRKVWIVVGAALTALLVAGMFFDGPDGDHRGHGGPMGAGRESAEHAQRAAEGGGGFFAGVLSMLGVLILAAGVFYVVRRVRAKKAASRAL